MSIYWMLSDKYLIIKQYLHIIYSKQENLVFGSNIFIYTLKINLINKKIYILYF